MPTAKHLEALDESTSRVVYHPAPVPEFTYRRSTTQQLVEDVRNGMGKPPPPGTPESYFPSSGHGWVSEGVDLSRVALDQLIDRERLKELPAGDRLHLDDMAFVDLRNYAATPGQLYLRRNLGDRWIDGKLTNEEQQRLYNSAVQFSLNVPAKVVIGENMPMNFTCDCWLPNSSRGRWAVQGHYNSILVDGHPVTRMPKYWTEDENWICRFEEATSGGRRGEQELMCSTLGVHHLLVTIQVDIRYGADAYPDRGVILHSQSLDFNAEFSVIEPSYLLAAWRAVMQSPSQVDLCFHAGPFAACLAAVEAKAKTVEMLQILRLRRGAEISR